MNRTSAKYGLLITSGIVLSLGVIFFVRYMINWAHSAAFLSLNIYSIGFGNLLLFHLAMVCICYGVYTALKKEGSFSPLFKTLLCAGGYCMILMGLIDISAFAAASPSKEAIPSSFLPLFTIHSIPTGLYAIATGILCLSVWALNEDKFTLNWLVVTGGLFFLILGVFHAYYFLEHGRNFLLAGIAFVCHAPVMFLFFGISGVINPEKLEILWLRKNLMIWASVIAILGFILPIWDYLRPEDLPLLTQSTMAMTALMFSSTLSIVAMSIGIVFLLSDIVPV